VLRVKVIGKLYLRSESRQLRQVIKGFRRSQKLYKEKGIPKI
jgi:hypothetical protein